MASGTLGVFGKLSAELRVEVFSHALKVDGRLRRLNYGEQSHLTALLRANKQVYEESVSLLYKQNVFLLSLSDMANFGNANDFSRIQHVVLSRKAVERTSRARDMEYVNDDGEDDDWVSDDGEDCQGVLSMAALLVRECKTLEARAADKTLHLRELIFPIDNVLASTVLQDGLSFPTYELVDVGKWKVSLGQTFDLVLVHGEARDIWRWVQQAANAYTFKQALMKLSGSSLFNRLQFKRDMLLLVALAADLRNIMMEHSGGGWLRSMRLSRNANLREVCKLIHENAKVRDAPSLLQVGPESGKKALCFSHGVLFGVLAAMETILSHHGQAQV